jgi:DtxR family Mn-dependent transcriptional regulator
MMEAGLNLKALRNRMTTQKQTRPHDKETKAVEDFLKSVYELQQTLPEGAKGVSTNALKDALRITAPSVTDMAKRLVDANLVLHEKYYGVLLTETGTAIALKVIRRHRLIELYLVRELGYALHEVHEDAEDLEHAVSDRFITAIARKLGDPVFDPHGDPIPAEDGSMIHRELHPLSELPVGASACVARLVSENTDLLQHTLDKGFVLGKRVEILARDPFDGPVTVKFDDREAVIGHSVAAAILVEVADE